MRFPGKSKQSVGNMLYENCEQVRRLLKVNYSPVKNQKDY